MSKSKLLVLYYRSVYYFQLAHPDVVFIGQTAAMLLEIPRWDEWDFDIHRLTRTRHSHEGKFRKHIVVINHFQFWISSVEDTLLELAFGGDRIISLVASISHCLYKGMTTLEDLKSFIAAHKGYPGVRRLKHALHFASEKDESPLESYFRIVCIEHNYIPLQQQKTVTTYLNGTPQNFRLDFYFEKNGQQYAIETDGKIKEELDPEYLQKQAIRDKLLLEMDIQPIHLGYAELKDGTFTQKLDAIGVPKRKTKTLKVEKY
jgi:hypothetical protein